jgi:glycosyltransferase involved in cell wall biosynthesis
MTNPSVSVIIPTYNQAMFIAEAIDSVLAQNYPKDEIEIIVIDDGSTDGTREAVERSASACRSGGVSLKSVHRLNNGKAIATKVGIDAASGKYIFNLDSDDKFLPDKIKKVVDVFESDKEIVHVAHPVIYWNADRDTKKVESVPDKIMGQKIRGQDLLLYFLKNNRFIGGGSTFAGRSEMLKKIDISKEMGFSVDAYLVYYSLNQGASFFMDEPLSLYRLHAGAYSLKNASQRSEIDAIANKAILSEMRGASFHDDIKLLQELRTIISDIKYKEFTGTKKSSDVLSLWSFVWTHRKAFGRDIFKIIAKYRILQRSMPII